MIALLILVLLGDLAHSQVSSVCNSNPDGSGSGNHGYAFDVVSGDKPIEIVGVKVQLYGSSSGTFYAYFRLGSSNLAYEAQDGKWDKRINVELSDLQLSDQEYTFWMDNNFTCPANSVCGIYLASDTLNIRYYNGATLGIVPGEVSLTAGWGRAGLFTGISGYPRFL